MKYFNENKQIVKAQEGIKTQNSVSAGNWKQVDDETIRPQYSLKPVTITGEHPMWSLPGYQGKQNEYRNLTLKDKNQIYKNALHRDEVGRQYAKFTAPAAMSPLIPILGVPTLASNLVSTAVHAPLETAMSIGGGLLGGNYVDRKVNQITGDANFGEMIGRVTGTPELSGVYQYGNPGYVVGGFLGEGLSPLVRSVAKGAQKVGRSAINSFQRIGDEIAGRIGSELSPAVATAGEVATETPVKESFMAFAKRRNKGGSNKTKTDGGKTNKENSKDITQQLENKVEQNVQNPAEVETSTQAPEKLVEREAPVETSTQAPVEAEASTKTSTENPEKLIEREVEVESEPTSINKEYIDESDIIDYYTKQRGNKPSNEYRKKNAKKFLDAQQRLKDQNYKESTKGKTKRHDDATIVKNYLGKQTKESQEKALKEAQKEALEFNSQRMAHNKKIVNWTVWPALGVTGVGSAIFFGNKASTNNRADDENQRTDVAGGNNKQTTTPTSTSTDSNTVSVPNYNDNDFDDSFFNEYQ